MATSIADEGRAAGKGSGVILGTALLTTTVATVLVGICIIVVGAPPGFSVHPSRLRPEPCSAAGGRQQLPTADPARCQTLSPEV